MDVLTVPAFMGEHALRAQVETLTRERDAEVKELLSLRAEDEVRCHNALRESDILRAQVETLTRERDEAREALDAANEYGDEMKRRFAEADEECARLRAQIESKERQGG